MERSSIVFSRVARLVGVALAMGLLAGPSMNAWAAGGPKPEAKATGFDAWMARAEEQRAAGEHDASARSYAAAYRSLSADEQVGLLGELAIDNAVTDYRLAYQAQPKGLALLEESTELLERFVADRRRAAGSGDAQAVPPRLHRELERLRGQIAQTIPTDGPLRVKVGPDVEYASLLPLWIMRRNTELGAVVGAAEATWWVEVEITGVVEEVRVKVVAMYESGPAGAMLEPVVCRCEHEQLLARVDEAIARVVEGIRDEPSGVEETVEPQPGPTRALTPMGKGGIAIASVGVVVVAGGVTMAVLPAQEVRADLVTYYERDYRPLGLVTLSVGAAALLTGATLLVLDRVRCRRAPQEPGCSGRGVGDSGLAAASSVRMSPALVSGGAGMVFVGRW